MHKYTIGIDYGTLSGRSALVDVTDGRILATAVYDYPHGVMDAELPTGEKLPPDWALQHPQDHLDVLLHTVPALLRQTGIDPADVIGLALDVTSATVMPAAADGTPLCLLPEYAHRPHAWMKLWKHHAAQSHADRMTQTALERKEDFLRHYGSKINSEWSLPKLYQVLDEAPDIYAAMAHWVESADWLVWQLTGHLTQNACSAGYKCLYRGGFPAPDYFAAVDPRLRRVIAEKLSAPVIPVGTQAGTLTADMARKLGLKPGTPVAAGNVDAHVSALAAGLTAPGTMASIIGTSACHMLLTEGDTNVNGICGAVDGGILPGYVGCEAGQPCVGDQLFWFTRQCVPAACYEAAQAQGMDIHQYLSEQASLLHPGQSGLLALDWWNGSRSPLGDAALSGLMLGLTLRTRPEEIYRALLESTAFGTRLIIENYRAHGVRVDALTALGGIARKNPLAMQILADVLHMPVTVADAAESGALGSAILAAAACGAYPTAADAVRAMSAPALAVYQPNENHRAVYDALYAEYAALSQHFGLESRAMKTLLSLRTPKEVL